ncbi:MAG: ATP-binding protein [Acidobacteriota bacterium]
MKGKRGNQLRIVKGRPLFRRHLYISTGLFVAIILVTGFVLVRFALDSVRERVEAEANFLADTYAQKISERIEVASLIGGKQPDPTSALDDAQIRSLIDELLSGQEEFAYLFVQNLAGEILWKGFRPGMELEQNHFSRILFHPRSPRSPRIELRSLTHPRNRITDVILPISPTDQNQLIVHLGLDQTHMERRFAEVRGGVLNRIVVAAGFLIGILVLALGYVLWLLKRAQVVEAEAHTADRLAYLGTLAGGLAHEIRNPLSAMNLNLQMIEEEMGGTLKPGGELSVLLAGTKQEIKRLDRLATNFLFYARPLGIERQKVDLGNLLEEIVRLVAQECQQSGIRVMRRPNAEAILAPVDRDLMKQAVLNLVVNAKEALQSGQNGLKEIELSAAKEEDEVIICVKDSGPGIRPEVARNLFKLFYSSKRGGTGLGLAIAQRIVEGHNGRIEWQNNEQGGASFQIVL